MEIIDQYVPEFSNYLLSKIPINFNNYFILLNEENIYTSANPFISLLISFYLKNNTNVILIASQESLNHYSTIAKKFGLNLNNNDKFCFLDLFYSPVKGLIKEELPLSENFPYTYNTNRSKFFYSNIDLTSEGVVNFQAVTQAIEIQIKKFNQENKTVVIFDNISTLPNDGEILMDNLNDIIKTTTEQNINLVINMNRDLSDEELYNYLYNLSDFEIEFKQNESGFSKDIDGRIKLYLKTSSLKEWNLRYYIKENGINFFSHLIV